MRISYHNHSKWSDGASTLKEMIEQAKKTGIEEFGISDHLILSPDNRRYSWALDADSLDAYVSEVRHLTGTAGDMKIRLGLEVDFFPETVEAVNKRLSEYSFDYIIGSVHFVDDFVVDLDARAWEELAQEDRNEIWRGYWRHLRAAAETGYFDIIGHFDLPKKFCRYPSIDLTADAIAALDAIASADTAIEINSAGWEKPAKEAYPAMFYLCEANRRGIPLIINDDAHAANEVGRNFDRALRLARRAGYKELVRFEQRRRYSYPL
ncbi:MAG TPA: histidinol-phosphatase HisJ family protein [Acidobacteriota bacterium]|nr:histidinol-phosphatase HisJ family protein [Acidobacteriota bacterium]